MSVGSAYLGIRRSVTCFSASCSPSLSMAKSQRYSLAPCEKVKIVKHLHRNKLWRWGSAKKDGCPHRVKDRRNAPVRNAFLDPDKLLEFAYELAIAH
ncbi:hypothetical protein EV356DRAFT_148365 [Viridothelium virens]|uniref:Uncharacterized protein n=1 Tax=Viridothelium virens TaxID=1048519 RepID=A0A6A6H924_VIRVR|nr:hypothetical protein EV356DRAFT_148365 [Viridothelium virens]